MPPYRAPSRCCNLASLQDLGAASRPLIRVSPAAYADGLNSPAGPSRPNPRVISNMVSQLPGLQPASSRDLSALVHAWGQVRCRCHQCATHTSTHTWKQHASRTLALFTSALTVRAYHARLLCTGSSSTTTCRECHPGSSAGTSRCQRCVVSTCTYPADCSAPVAHPLNCGALLTGRCCV